MHPLFFFLGIVPAYMLMAAYSKARFAPWVERQNYNKEDKGITVFFLTVVWPIAFIFAAGNILARRGPRGTEREKISRTEKRRRREIAEAQHRLQLARLEGERLKEVEHAAFGRELV